MYYEDSIKVRLLNPDEVKQFIWRHGRVAEVCYNTPEGNEERVAIHCMDSGHMSGSRGNYIVFEVESPRYTADQILRHEIGVFKNMQSQRYVKPEDISVYMKLEHQLDARISFTIDTLENHIKAAYKSLEQTMEDKGITGEERNEILRTILPIGIKTKFVIGFTVEALEHFCNKRLCLRADEPIRIVAEKMKYAVLEVEPRFKPLLVPQCAKYLYCPEGKGCGMRPSKDKVINVLNKSDVKGVEN